MKRFNDPSVLRSINHIRAKANEVNVGVTHHHVKHCGTNSHFRASLPRKASHYPPLTSSPTRRNSTSLVLACLSWR